jgi:serine/threonine-protein kinase
MTPVAGLSRATRSDYSLPDDYVALMARRLAVAGAISAGIHLVYLVLYRTVWIATAHDVGFATGIVGLVASIVCAAYLFTGSRNAFQVAVAAIATEILLTFALGTSDAWSLSYDRPVSQVPWAGVVIVSFAHMIPATPRVVLAASLVSAATTPLAMALVFFLKGRVWPEASITASALLPGFFCALLAWAPANAIQRLGAAVQRARRVGSYELSKQLGSGGMGEVWLAHHRLLARPAAVKLIKTERLGAKDETTRALVLSRFEKEAKVTANLDSPHTVELYDFGVSSNGELYYVMELLDGVDAETLVERFGPLPSERVAYLLMQACDSLEEAHQRGLVHRDVKPANLFISRKGVEFDFLKVLDFGLVKHWHSENESELAKAFSSANLGNTAIGQIVGTPAYLAPEAAVSEEGVDHRTDLYAIGCVGYWLLTASTVFDDATAMGMAIAHVTKVPEPPSSRIAGPIAPELERIVLRCLAKDPHDRPASARELRELLSSIRFAEPWSRERAALWWHDRSPKADRMVP